MKVVLQTILEAVSGKKSNPMNVLVSSLSQKVSLVKTLRQAYEMLNLKGEIYGADSNANCVGRYFVDAFWHMPPLDTLAISDLVTYCRRHHIQAIIPTRDGELLYYAKNREALQSQGIQVMVSSSEAVAKCNNKLAFYQELSQKGFPVIVTLESPDDALAKRWVVKECDSSGSRNICLDVSLPDAKKAALRFSNPVFQPFIQGGEYSVDLYVAQTGQVLGCVARRRDVVQHGESCITTTCDFPDLEKCCAKMAQALGLYGHVLFQVIQSENDGKLYVVECNARFGGASVLSIAAGLNSFVWFFQEVQGYAVDDFPFQPSPVKKKLIRFAEDRIIDDPGV